jgi:hypothetical protein
MTNADDGFIHLATLLRRFDLERVGIEGSGSSPPRKAVVGNQDAHNTMRDTSSAMSHHPRSRGARDAFLCERLF